MMTMIPASVLTPEIAAEIPDMPYPAIERNLVLSTRAFCEASPVWQDTFNVTAANRVISLDGLSPDGEVVHLMPRGLSQADRQLPVSARPNGDVLGYYPQSRRVLVITTSTTSNTFAATVQLRPLADKGLMPEDVVDDYRDAIISGALYRAYRMAKAAWANGEMAQAHKAMFDEAVKRSLTDVRRTPTEQAV